jgi:3-methyladenine DNA glycosylase/8-oxoguanine DNA glycosylase
MLALRRVDLWPAGDLALRRAAERIWRLDPPASVDQVTRSGSASGRGARSPPHTSISGLSH